jgi:hypothetical protein
MTTNALSVAQKTMVEAAAAGVQDRVAHVGRQTIQTVTQGLAVHLQHNVKETQTLTF